MKSFAFFVPNKQAEVAWRVMVQEHEKGPERVLFLMCDMWECVEKSMSLCGIIFRYATNQHACQPCVVYPADAHVGTAGEAWELHHPRRRREGTMDTHHSLRAPS